MRKVMSWSGLVVLVTGLLIAPLSASAAPSGLPPCTGAIASAVCQIGAGGGDGTGGSNNTDNPLGVNAPSDFTAGPVQCLMGAGDAREEVPCTIRAGDWWSNDRQCYVSLDPDQEPSGVPMRPGAWYLCQNYTDLSDENGNCSPILGCLSIDGSRFYAVDPPPGITTYSPAQAAADVIAEFELTGIEVGLAPDPNVPGARTYVGVPIWMWASNPTETNFGPFERTVSRGGVTVTAAASVSSVLWNMGDGTTVTCASGGTPYNPNLGFTTSPTCGHLYAQTSAAQPNGRYPITATSQWTVTWNANGVTGSQNITTVSESSIEVRELQSVNVGN